MRVFYGALLIGLAASCSLLDSVNGYDGPPLDASVAPSDAHAEDGKTQPTDANLDGLTSPCVDAAECDDDNPCTDDSCWGSLCRHMPKPNTSCSDSNVCNGDEVCDDKGDCQPGKPLPLSDDNPCTDDTCDPKLGVQHTLQQNPAMIIVECGIVTCPAGYYVSKLTCLSQCGACNPTYCVNGVECTRICEKSLPVCCGNTCSGCPSGYTQTATYTSGDCGCGPGATETCVR